MAPPRDLDADAGAPTAGPDAYDALCARVAEVQGLINLADARLVSLAQQALEIGVSSADGLTPEKWLAWRAGISIGHAHDVFHVARRADELPATFATFSSGKLTLDQAAQIARNIDARYDQSAARVAQHCTPAQLRDTLRWYRPTKDDKPRPEDRTVQTGRDERGWWLRMRLPDDEGARVDAMLKANREDLWRLARADAKASGTDPIPVTLADAFLAGIDQALDAAATAHPGSDRYLVHCHLQLGPEGIELATHLGIPLPAGQRRQILCDTRLRGIIQDGVTPVGIGRTTQIINRRMRRWIEHRDGGCGVPGCGRTHDLEIHHIWHWEDGGPTESWNLITLCRFHHTAHHQGTLNITGNADLPRHRAPGVVFTNQWDRPLPAVGRPAPPSGATLAEAADHIGTGTHTYQPPSGERIDPWGFHLMENDPTPEDDLEPDIEADPPPARSSDRTPPPNVPGSPDGADPTRAGPHA